MEEVYLLVKNNYDIILGVLVSWLVTRFLVMKKFREPSNAIPGRLGLPLLGETFSFISACNSSKGCYEFIRLRRQWYGKWFKTRFFGQVHVFVPSVAAAKTILSNQQRFRTYYMKSIADAAGKRSLSNLSDEDHKRVKRLLSAPLSTDSLSVFVSRFDNLISKKLKKLAEEGKSFVLLDFNMKVTCKALCDMMMSIKDESLLDKIDRECTAVSKAAMTALPLMIPGTAYYKGMKARARVMKIFQEIIASRRSGIDAHQDFLQSMLQRESFPADEKLDDLEIMDNMITLILAGQGTTANTITWCVKYLDENKQVQNKLREEQLSILRAKPTGELLCLEDLKKMSYGSKVIKETLRLSNAVLWVPRVASEDCKIQDFDIKKGWCVNVDSTHIHQDPAVYKDPLQFNPSRFDEIPKPYTFLPFGSGPRMCLGMNMANVIMLVVLHRLTSAYNWIVDDHDPSLEKKALLPILRSRLPITLTALKDESSCSA